LLQLGQPEVRCAVCGFPLQAADLLKQEVQVRGDKVLCIEDDPVFVILLTRTLKAGGFVPLTAPDGPTGLTLAAAERPRLILLDIMMPEMDGFEVCRRLKADPRTAAIPVIILTGLADAKLNIQAFRVGAALALIKPFKPEQLIATLRAALAMKQGRPSA
jgi:DNA-binding response OmpR family regulator